MIYQVFSGFHPRQPFENIQPLHVHSNVEYVDSDLIMYHIVYSKMDIPDLYKPVKNLEQDPIGLIYIQIHFLMNPPFLQSIDLIRYSYKDFSLINVSVDFPSVEIVFHNDDNDDIEHFLGAFFTNHKYTLLSPINHDSSVENTIDEISPSVVVNPSDDKLVLYDLRMASQFNVDTNGILAIFIASWTISGCV